jgi:hopanoid biosynthesis associated protein HpnK
MPRHLVVNADDLGLTTGVNDGIFDAHERGILTSASLFAGAPATADAIRRARARTSLGVGVHLALVDGAPTLPASSVPTLVTGDGRFRLSWRPFVAACLRGQVSMREVERELAAQIERLAGAGIRLTHLDAHKHVHLYPPVFAIVARLAVRFGIPVVRVPYERGSWLNGALWPWARRNYHEAERLGLRTPQFIGRVDTGALGRDALRPLLRGIGPGVTELMVHPGYVDDALRCWPTRLVDSRREEVALLCSLQTRMLLVRERIGLVRHDLAPSVHRSLRHAS